MGGRAVIRRFGTGRKTGGALLILILLSLGVGVLIWKVTTGDAQSAVTIAVDMDVTGNNARLTSGVSIKDCTEISSSGTNTATFDVLIPAPGVGATDGIKGFQFDVLYNSAAVNVTSEDQNFLLNQAPGSNLISASDSLPDSDGSFTSATVDFGPPGIEPTGAQEKGPGVLARITVTGVAPGSSPLSLSNIILLDVNGNDIPINSVINGLVVVDGFCPTTVTVVKVVDNTGGGTATVSNFTLRVDGNAVTSGVANNVGPGAHVISEDNPGAAYTSTIGGDCAANGSITLSTGQNKICTITNTFVPPHLTVVKVVNNTGGGTATVSNFTLRIDGGVVTSGVANTVTPGTHTVSEDNPGAAYTKAIGGDCSAGGTISLSGGQNRTCIITNTFVPPILTVTKIVDNSAGGSAVVGDFTLRVDGNIVTSGTPNTITPGTHAVTEDNPGPDYVTSFGGGCTPSGTVSLAGGDIKNCIVTNTFSPTSTITVGSGSGGPGSTVTVPLQALGVPTSLRLGATTIDVLFDPAVLTPTACAKDPNNVLDSSQCNITFAPGNVRFVGIDITGESGNILLANLSFQGVGTTTLTPSVVTYTDPTGADLPTVTQNGSITIGPVTGDVDCDTDIDAIDALFVLQYVSGLRTGGVGCPPAVGQLYLTAADVNASGGVNVVDALFLFQCVVGIPNGFCPSATTDIAISAQSALNPPTSIPAGQNATLTFQKTIHNNGPYTPVNANVSGTLQAPADCTVVPSGGNPSTVSNLNVSIAVVVQESFTVNCSQPSLHTFTLSNSISIATAGVTDTTPANNSASTQISIPVAAADLTISAQSALNPPASIPINTDTVLTFEKTVHNNGPFTPIDAGIVASLSAPADCTVTPNPANPTSVTGLVASVATVVQESFTVNCSQPSFHTFSLNNTASITTAGVPDPTPANNSATTQVVIPVTASADLTISAQSALNPPASIPINTDTVLTFEKTVHNNGPLTPVDVTISASLAAPADCAVIPNPTNPTSLTNLAASIATVVQESFTVNCSQPSFHAFTLNNTLSPANPHVSDPNALDNSATTQVVIPVTASADITISAQSALNPPASIPVNTNTVLTFEKTIHNNGPLSPVDVTITASLAAPPDCAVTPNPANPTSLTNLAASIATVIQESFTVNCSQPSFHSFTLNNSLSHSNPHVSDPNALDNSASTQITIPVAASTDAEITTQSAVNPPASIPLNTDTVLTFDKTVHNNGPFTPVDLTISANLSAPVDCTVTPNPANPTSVTDLAASIATVVQESFTVNCSQTSLHTFTLNNAISVATAGVTDSNAANDSASTQVSIPVVAADVAISAQSALNPPSSIPVNTDTVLTFEKTLHNNGPFTPVDVGLAPSLSAPADCSVTPNPANPTSVTGLVASVATVVQESFTVNCSQPSFHTFTLNNTASITTPGVPDPTPANNSATTQVVIPVTASTDLAISAQSALNPPASIPINTDTVLTFEKTVHNNGPFTPVDVTISASLSAPPDCTVTPNPANPTSIAGLAVSIAAVVQESFTVNCSQPSFHSFTLNNAVAATDAHISDPNTLNNSASTQVTTSVTASADLTISAQSALNPPASMPVNTDTVLTFDKTVHNNGPFTPVDVTISASLSAPPDCTVTPNPANPTSVPGLAVSIATVVQESFTVNCSQPSFHSFTLNNTIAPTDPHISDPNALDNSASTPVTSPVTASADITISAQSALNPPASIPVNTDTVLTFEKTIHNNGPFTPVDVTISASLSAPADCTVTPNPANPTSVPNLAASIATVVQESFTVNCSQPSFHSFTLNNTIAPTDPHITDPNALDNSASTPVTIPVTATADLTISAQSAVSPPASMPANTDTVLTFQTTVHNNGPFTPVDAGFTATLSGPVDCTITPSPTNPTSVPGLAASVATVVQTSFTVNCSTVSTPTFTLDSSIAASDTHISDPNTLDNSASTQVTIVVL